MVLPRPASIPSSLVSLELSVLLLNSSSTVLLELLSKDQSPSPPRSGLRLLVLSCKLRWDGYDSRPVREKTSVRKGWTRQDLERRALLTVLYHQRSCALQPFLPNRFIFVISKLELFACAMILLHLSSLVISEVK